jgi:hypothetical protein
MVYNIMAEYKRLVVLDIIYKLDDTPRFAAGHWCIKTNINKIISEIIRKIEIEYGMFM